MEKSYRPGVVAVISDMSGFVLAGERSDQAGAWQLPQGGIDFGETPEQAVMRELLEEIGTNSVMEVGRSQKAICYDFPVNMGKLGLRDYRGQAQFWFHFHLQENAAPDLSVSDGEFQNLAWMDPRALLNGIIDWKRAAYSEGFRSLGLI